jgi:hypothetical protein
MFRIKKLGRMACISKGKFIPWQEIQMSGPLRAPIAGDLEIS